MAVDILLLFIAVVNNLNIMTIIWLVYYSV